MAKIIGNITNFSGGIADNSKLGSANSFKFGRSIDFRSDPSQLTLLPRTEKESGNVVIDFPKWGERIGTDLWVIGDAGNVYKRTTGGTWTNEHTASASQGNGLKYFGEDDFLYYGQNTTFGRYGPINGTPVWYDDFKGSEGGVPTNTHSIDFEADSSMYASRADTASLSIVADLTLEAYLKPESLPTSGGEMVIMSKWDENGNLRSYKLSINAVSNSFGDGSDGALTISSDTTEAPIDSACTGTVDTQALTATNASFSAGQKILIHQTQGVGAGTYQRTEIQSYTAGTITTTDALNFTYITGAQVRVLKQYSSVTVNADKTYTGKEWNGTVGGLPGFYCSGDVKGPGKIMIGGVTGNTGLGAVSGATGGGFRGGDGNSTTTPNTSTQGEGDAGTGSESTEANGTGGGGGLISGANRATGGGGGHATDGTAGTSHKSSGVDSDTWTAGVGGGQSGAADMSQFTFGGGGGGSSDVGTNNTSSGASGGGALFIQAKNIDTSLVIDANGGDGINTETAGGAGGAGGSVFLRVDTATLGTNLITATGGARGTFPTAPNDSGGAGGEGRVHIDYATSYTGTSSPTINATLDSSLSTSDGHALKLQVSDDGTAEESYTQAIEISTDVWNRWGVVFDSSDSEADFYKDGTLIGTKTGSMTAIDDNASKFAIACMFDSATGAAENFYDGLMDDVRVWNDIRTASEMKSKSDRELVGTEANLVAYYELDNALTDSQSSGNNDLTGTNSPTYSTDVPFSGVTTRADLDQSLDTSGNTYTLTTAVNEGATHRQSFVPAKDPQESAEVRIAATGTGDWTLVVHDSLNREVASKTVTNANLNTGDFEFIFSSVWRPVIGATYHFHLTSTVADGTVTTTTASDLETADFHTYYQFLVSDKYHPMTQHLNNLVIGNERYLATLTGGGTYNPHELTFPSGHRVRALGFYREYLAIGTWQGTNITDFDSGRIFFWDGIADTYNFFIDVPEGGINALLGTPQGLYIWAGYSGDILLYQGGDRAAKAKQVPKMVLDKWMEVEPGGVAMWRSLVHFNVAGDSDSTAIEKGTYSWGQKTQRSPLALGYDYPLSIGVRTGTDVDVGMLQASGQDLFIGWRNGVAYGVDKVSVGNSPFSTGRIDLLTTDLGRISKDKQPLTLRTDFKKLVSGESILNKWDNDRTGIFQSQTEDSTDAEENRQRVDGESREIDIRIDLETTTTTSPTLLGISLESDDAKGDRNA